MPMSAESAARADERTDTPILDAHTQYFQPDPDPTVEPTRPSEVVEPTKIDTAAQQGATQPGAGTEVHVMPPPNQPSFKEKVVGYAKEIRGTALRKPETKEQGERILHGQEPWGPKKSESGDM